MWDCQPSHSWLTDVQTYSIIWVLKSLPRMLAALIGTWSRTDMSTWRWHGRQIRKNNGVIIIYMTTISLVTLCGCIQGVPKLNRIHWRSRSRHKNVPKLSYEDVCFFIKNKRRTVVANENRNTIIITLALKRIELNVRLIGKKAIG